MIMKGLARNIAVQFFFLAGIVSCLSSCVREDLPYDEVEEGLPVIASLSFGVPAGDDVVVSTKAEDINNYSEITSLYLFIYNEDGSRCEDVIAVSDDAAITDRGENSEYGGRHYTIKINTTTGTKRIFTVANYLNVQSWKSFRTTIETLGTEALSGSLTLSEVANEIVYLRDTYINNGTTPEYPTQQMIFTSDVAGDEVTFSRTGTSGSGTADGMINLKRIVANVIFKITNGTENGKRISFTPSSYQLFNLPKATRLGSDRTTEADPPEAASTFYYDGSVQTLNTTAVDNVYTFDFFMPENIQKNVSGVKSYNMRDEWDFSGEGGASGPGASNGDKTWKYAPENATYIVINGEYAEYSVSGNQETLLYSGSTSYVIHLGNFSNDGGSFGDFSVKRNWRYTYNITIKGVDRIIAEAEAGDAGGQGEEPGAEGGIVNINDITLSYSLDAHYEQVLLSYNLSNIMASVYSLAGDDWKNDDDGDGVSNIDELIGNNLILYTESPFQDGAVMKVPYSDYVANRGPTNKETFLEDIDYKWVEFLPQESSSDLSPYPGLPLWKNGGADINTASELNERLLDVYDVCVKLGQAVRKLWDYGAKNGFDENLDYSSVLNSKEYEENGITVVYNRYRRSWYAYFTGFVDEYYYTENPLTGESIGKWSEFTNKDQRRMMISMNIQVSGDGNSTYSTAHTNISQRSIQTFYDDDSDLGSFTAFGIETFNETSAVKYGSSSNDNEDYSDIDGRSNTILFLDIDNGTTFWSEYLNAGDNGHKSSVSGIRKIDAAYNSDNLSAFSAILSRNRDLDGNGTIDKDEIRWYLPSINEYIRIGMGANAIPNEAQLYIGDKNGLTLPGYPQDFIQYGALYHTSTNNSNKVTYWAVEKGSYGDQKTGYNGGRYMIRCIRLLPSKVDADMGNFTETPVPVYQLKEMDSGNYFFDFRGRLTPSLFRQIPNTYPYNFVQHNEDDEYNRFYDAMVLSKDYTTSWSSSSNNIGYTLQQFQNIGNNRSNPCAGYHEDGEPDNAGWRLPNLVELTVLASNYADFIRDGLPNNGNALVPCCTQFTNQSVRQAFYVNTRQMVTCGDDYDGQKPFYVRCVRDATDDELLSDWPSSGS